MRTCTHTKPDGKRCKAPARAGSDLCFFHDPSVEGRRKAAQARGGRRRTRAAAASKAPAKKGRKKTKATKKSQPAQAPTAAQEDVQTLAVQPGTTLSDDQLEATLATAITAGTEGKLSAPVLANITRLVGIYETFLNRKRERSDVDKARKLTNEELHKQMFRHLPTEVLLAEVERRHARGKKNADQRRPGTAAAQPASGSPARGKAAVEEAVAVGDGPAAGHRKEDERPVRGGDERPRVCDQGASDGGHPKGEVPASPAGGAPQRPPVNGAWRI